MKFLNKMERKFGRYAISNLTWYIIITYVAGYLLMLTTPGMIRYLTLEPALIFRGQVWRIVSWLLIPPQQLDLFTILMLFFYYSVGNALERTWGTFRYNVYVFSGILMSIVGAFLLYFIAGGHGIFLGGLFSTYYISMSLILAFAATYPNMQVWLMGIIPLKMKWLGILDAIYLLVDMIKLGWVVRVAIICSLMNFIIFFFATRNMSRYNPREIQRKQNYKKQFTRAR